MLNCLSVKTKDRTELLMGGRNEDNSNIIAFPNLCKRLVDKGLERLEVRDFKKAAELFSQARELEPENPDLNIGLVVALVELNDYEEARDLCKELLFKGIGDYFHVVTIYLMVLLHLNEHQEMVTTIEALLEEGHVPSDKIDHFENMLYFSRRAIDEQKDQEVRIEEKIQEELAEDEGLFENKTDNELLAVVSRLSKVNIRPHMDQIKLVLENNQISPFVKTLLLNILQEQEYDKELTISKFSKQMNVIPSTLSAPNETDFYLHSVKLLEAHLGDRDPTLFDMAVSLIERQHLVMYPFVPEQAKYSGYAAGYHLLAEEYLYGESSIERIAELYQVDQDQAAETLKVLREIEDFSSPII